MEVGTVARYPGRMTLPDGVGDYPADHHAGDVRGGRGAGCYAGACGSESLLTAIGNVFEERAHPDKEFGGDVILGIMPGARL